MNMRLQKETLKEKALNRMTKVSKETADDKGSKFTYDNVTSVSEKNLRGIYVLTNTYQYDELN